MSLIVGCDAGKICFIFTYMKLDATRDGYDILFCMRIPTLYTTKSLNISLYLTCVYECFIYMDMQAFIILKLTSQF